MINYNETKQINNIEEIRNYCLNCKNKPCKDKGCPLENDIPVFIHETNIKKAFEKLSRTTVLPAICGKICPHTKQCENSCIRGIKGNSVSIGEFEQYIGIESINNNYEIPKITYNKSNDDKILNTKKVAIIGSGPAGLTCAAFLARNGVYVKIFEKNPKLGGLLRYGIPDFRLERTIVDSTIEKILNLGIDYEVNCSLGEDILLEELSNKYDAVCLAIGANEPNITLDGNNVLSGNKLLEDFNLNNNSLPEFKGKKVYVSGGRKCSNGFCKNYKKAWS